MSTLRVNTLQSTSTTDGGISIDTSGNVTLPANTKVGTQNLPSAGPLSNRNKIINGDMRIDQRNAGASITANDGSFAVDRFRFSVTQSSKGTGQQSTTAPTGFTNSLLFTSTAETSLAAGDVFEIIHPLEGFNSADLAWGSAAAKNVTLSFWVRSSLTGTFGGAFQNNAADRSYPFEYTISSANTWENKTITVPGDTSGTWLSTNGIGIRLIWGLGVGTTKSGTAGSWAGSNFQSATGATSVVGTNGATFYLTGVQLEVGSVATPFEHRSYGDELALCQRYFQSATVGIVSSGYGGSYFAFPVTMRATPTVTGTGNAGYGNSALTSYGIQQYQTTGSSVAQTFAAEL